MALKVCVRPPVRGLRVGQTPPLSRLGLPSITARLQKATSEHRGDRGLQCI